MSNESSVYSYYDGAGNYRGVNLEAVVSYELISSDFIEEENEEDLKKEDLDKEIYLVLVLNLINGKEVLVVGREYIEDILDYIDEKYSGADIYQRVLEMKELEDNE